MAAPTPQATTHAPALAARIVSLAAALAVAVGGTVITGWLLDVRTLKGAVLGSTVMNFNAASCFVLAGLSLWALKGTRSRWRWLGGLAAFVVALTGLFTLAEFIVGWSVGINRLFIHPPPGESVLHYRMAPHAAFCLLLAGAALMLLHTRRARKVAQALSFLLLVVAWLALVSYPYGVTYSSMRLPAMALFSALTFIALGAGLLCARPTEGLVGLLAGDRLGSRLARRLLPAALGCPFILGWLRVVGERAGLYDSSFGVALLITSSVVILVAFIWRAAAGLNRAHALRRHAEEELRRSHDELEARVRERTAELERQSAQLRASEQMLALAQEAGQVGAFDWDVRTGAVAWTAQLEALFGLPPGGFGGKSEHWRERVHADDLRECEATIAAAIARKSEEWHAVYRMTRADTGALRWIDAQSRLFYDEEGRALRMVGINIDITERRRVEESMREAAAVAERSRAQFEAVFQAVTDGIVVLDVAGNFLFVNEAEARLNGYASADEMKRDLAYFAEIYELTHPDGRPVPFAEWPVSKVLRGESVSNWELRGRRRDTGQEWFFSFNGEPVRDEEGRQVLAVVVTHDITASRQAREALRFQAQLLDTVEQAVIATDADGRITYWNRFAETLYGWTAADALGRNIIEVTPADESKAQGTEIMSRLAAGQSWSGEFQVRRRDGSLFPAQVTDTPIFDAEGRLVGVVGVSVDITERRRAEGERNELLRRERTARAQAEEASRLKDEFLATVSHELRTPMTAILGWARLLQTTELDAATTWRAFDTIERNARAQAQLIEDLLDVSRVVAGKLRLEVRQVELAPIIETAIEAARPAADAKGVALHRLTDGDMLAVLGDADRLQQVVWNLLSNAIKFTPQGGEVRVGLTRRDGRAEISVRDTGQGIAPEFLPFVFDRFRQGDATTTRQHGGLGLGLAIVRHLVELHGGTVAADSAGEGQGATFTVALPVTELRNADFGLRNKEATADQSAIRNPQSAILQGVRVLVVDDEPDAREFLTLALARGGAHVLTAATAAEALAALRRERPDLLVADIGMPGTDGYALIREVRAEEGTQGLARLPAVALTAYARPDDRGQALLAGFDAHVAKPVEPAELLAQLARLARVGIKNEG